MSRIIFVSSPFAGRGADDVEAMWDRDRNVRFVERLCRRIALNTTLIPLAPHLLFPHFLNDGSVRERELSITYAEPIIKCACRALFAVPPWRTEQLSSGMEAELALVRQFGMSYGIARNDAMLEWLLQRLTERYPRVA